MNRCPRIDSESRGEVDEAEEWKARVTSDNLELYVLQVTALISMSVVGVDMNVTTWKRARVDVYVR